MSLLGTSSVLTMRQFLDLWRNVYIPNGSTLMIEGAPGTGKTKIPLQWLAQAAQPSSADFGACFMNAASAESIDWSGLPLMTTTTMIDGQLVNDCRTHTGMPQWLQPAEQEGLRGAFPAFCPMHLRPADKSSAPMPSHLEAAYSTAVQQIQSRRLVPYTRGVVVIDECRQVGDPAAMLPMAQVADDGRVRQWGVPRGPGHWAVLMISNRTSDPNAGVQDLHSHTKNRMAIRQVRITYEDVVTHWHRIGMHEPMVFFAKAMPQSVFSDTVPEDGRQFPSARQWDYADREIRTWMKNVAKLAPTDKVPDHAETRGIISARCGDGTANDFFMYLNCYELVPDYDEVVDNPMKARYDQDNQLAAYTTAEMLAKHLSMEDMVPVGQYVRRLGKVIANQFAERVLDLHQFAALRDSDFAELVDWLGDAAKERLWQGA